MVFADFVVVPYDDDDGDDDGTGGKDNKDDNVVVDDDNPNDKHSYSTRYNFNWSFNNAVSFNR